MAEAAAGGTADELSATRERLARVRRELRAALEGLDADTLDWRPSPDRWSAGECALHLLETNRAYLPKTEAVIARERASGRTGQGPFRYGRFSRWFLAQMEPGNPRRLPAPKPFRPRQRHVDAGVVAALDDTLVGLDRAMVEAAGLDLARARVPTPVTPLLRFPLGIVLQMLVAHTERHLRQAERVLAEPNCPGARGETRPGQTAG